MDTDRNLLFGILAVQMNFISRDALIAAMNAWVLDKHKALGKILAEQGQLSAERLQLLDALVNEHVKAHGDSPQQSLAALSSVSSVKPLLQQVQDGDVQASVAAVGTAWQEQSTAAERPQEGMRFRILRPYAKGGLGEVFVAEDTELHREVALKEIQMQHAANDASRRRFVLEAEITGKLEHPGVVPVYGLGAYHDGRPFYAMRFVHGDNLKAAAERFHSKRWRSASAFSSLEFRHLLGSFINVCNAVAYAHSRGVLHRDLKPENIMLGKFGETLVVDWGLAKVTGTSGAKDDKRQRPSDAATLVVDCGENPIETVAGSAVGTPAYMSPEQAAGKVDELGPATDIYSLGATLYALLTNQPPILGDTLGEVLQRVQKGDWLPPRTVNRAIPAVLDSICRKAMALRQADRYSSTLALAEDLEHWLADESVTASRESPTTRGRRWLRRHPRVVASLAATLMVGLIGIGINSVVILPAALPMNPSRL